MYEMFKEFWRKLLKMDRLCRDCEGRGRWQTETTAPDGLTQVETHFCHTCQGRGFITNDDDIDDFDLGGVGASEFDSDEDDDA